MSRTSLTILSACLLGAGALVAAELFTQEGSTAPLDPGASGPMGAMTAPAASVDAPVADAMAGASILARPLFATTRRPPPPVAPPGQEGPAALGPLPRVSGIVISAGERRVILSIDGAAKPVTAIAGATVGPWTIEAIEPGHVTLGGADGIHDLRPAYAADAEALARGPGFPPSADFGAPVPVPVPGFASSTGAPQVAERRFTRGAAAVASNRMEPGR